MTNEDKIKVLAELDGFVVAIQKDFKNLKCAVKHCDYSGGSIWVEAKPYLTSYDAIIPLIQKQSKEIVESVVCMFYDYTRREVDDMAAQLMATPEQLADALIKAVGKWKNDPNDTTTIIGGKEYQ